MTDEEFMREALAEARKAYDIGEVPVGAVAVWDGRIVGRGYNRRETDRNALRHAEIAAIDEACRTLGGWRLWKCELFVTLEPCPMCAGAIINARVKRVVFGASDPKNGALGSVTDLSQMSFNHKPIVESGMLEDECSRLLSDFFEKLREEKDSSGK